MCLQVILEVGVILTFPWLAHTTAVIQIREQTVNLPNWRARVTPIAIQHVLDDEFLVSIA